MRVRKGENGAFFHTFERVEMKVRRKYRLKIPYLIGTVLAIISCASADYKSAASGTYYWTASYYGKKFHGRPTSSGEIFNMYGDTAAHKTLPFGTRLKVTNTMNNKAVFVTVNDRGPFIEGRQLDLSFGAAKKIGMISTGTAKVRADIIGRDKRYVKYIRVDSVKGPFTIQIGSFEDRENALRLKNILAESYQNVYIENVNINGSGYVRVCVGKFASRDIAERVARKLADEGYGAIVITYGKQA